MALSITKKLLAGPVLAGAIGIGATAGTAAAYISDTDPTNVDGIYCDFNRSWWADEVEWGDNRNGNSSVEVKGTLSFHDFQGGSCRLYVRYYNQAGTQVASDTHTINHNWPTPTSSYASESNSNTSIVKARVCTQSKKQYQNSWRNTRCATALRGD